MKQYEITLTGHFEKTVSIYADSPEQAAEKLKIVLFDTDLIAFSDEDFVCGEADIKDENEDGCEENAAEDEDMEDVCCSDCPCFRMMCKGCRQKDGD
ncbi:hypothetical protein D3Z50_02565 [Clostridiaceae bacterium]|nr:hypothetical protein [Clostridiaceae bacterium]